MKKAMFLAVCITLFAAAPAMCLSVPTLINYQGVLTDANGNLITGTLTKTMIFAVYDAANGGVMKWGPETQTVQIISGQFNVLLGSVLSNPAITTAFDGPDRYLSIKVDGVELLPRQQILSTGYAVQAERAAKADNATNAVNATNAANSNLLQNYDVNALKELFRKPDYDSNWMRVNVRTTYTITHDLNTTDFSNIMVMNRKSNGEILPNLSFFVGGATNLDMPYGVRLGLDSLNSLKATPWDSDTNNLGWYEMRIKIWK